MKKKWMVVLLMAALSLLMASGALALNATDLAATIEEQSDGKLIAVANASAKTVTVTNVDSFPEYDASSGIALDPDADVKILWRAVMSCASGNSAVSLTAGTLTVETRGAIRMTGAGDTALSAAGDAKIIVDGGKVSAEGSGTQAIYATGDVTVKGGTVSLKGSAKYAIYTSAGNVLIDGGTVSAEAPAGEFCTAIMASSRTVTIKNKSNVSAKGEGRNTAISGSVGATIDDSTVSAEGQGCNAVVSGNGDVHIKNDSNVSATAGGNYAVYAQFGAVTIEKSTIKQAGDGGYAVEAGKAVNIKNSTVSAEGNKCYAVKAGNNESLTVDGGCISVDGDNGIGLVGDNIIVKGDAQVSAKSVSPDSASITAISAEVSATVEDSAQVSAEGTNAVTLIVEHPTVIDGLKATIRGGTLSSQGTDSATIVSNRGKTYLLGGTATGAIRATTVLLIGTSVDAGAITRVYTDPTGYYTGDRADRFAAGNFNFVEGRNLFRLDSVQLTPAAGAPPVVVEGEIGYGKLDLTGAIVDVTGTTHYRKNTYEPMIFEAEYNDSLVSVAVSGAKVLDYELADFTVTDLVINPRPKQPVITGDNDLGGAAGSVGALNVKVALVDADVSSSAPLAIKCQILDGNQMLMAEAQAEATANGEVVIAFASGSLDSLAPGAYSIVALSKGNFTNYPVASVDVGQLTIRLPAPPSLSQPVIAGENELTAEAGAVGALEVELALTNASVSVGAPLVIRCEVAGENQAVAAEAEATANGDVTVVFEETSLNDLVPGEYQITALSDGNAANYAVKAVDVGTLTIESAGPGGWAMPEKFKATKGFSYQLIEGVPAGRPLPTIVPESGRKKVATIGTDGVLTALKKGKTTVTVKGSKLKCVVTVVKNQVTAKAPKPPKGSGMHAALKKLSYNKKGELVLELHLMNRTGEKFKSAEGLTLTIAQGEEVRLERRFSIDRERVLGAGGNGTFKLVLAEEALKGLDLPNAGLSVNVTGWTDAKVVFEAEDE